MTADLAHLPPMAIAERIPRLQQRMTEDGLAAMLVSSTTNIRYLSGFAGSNGVLLVTAESATLLTDGRYTEQAPKELKALGVDATVDITSNLFGGAAQLIGAADSLGFESAVLTFADHEQLAKVVDVSLVPTSRLVEDLRARKDVGEVARIEAAAALADAALEATQPLLLERPTEQHFGFELDTAMRRLGADERSFETIVASGPNGALPHARPSGRVIEQGDLVVLDFGALVDGYHSDMTRTKMVGEPTAKQREMLEVVTLAQAAGRDAVGAGVEAKVIDETCRSIIDEAGYGDAFMHGTGHGVGLDIHEFPAVSSRSDTMLQTGHVITVEPGVYLPGIGGVRVEDTVVVTDDGYRALTRSSKDFRTEVTEVTEVTNANAKDKN